MTGLPPDWREVPLASVAEVRLGRQRSPKNHAGEQMRPYVRAANVSWSGLQLNDVKSMNFSDAEMDTYRLASGDLLLGEASGSPHEVGKPALWRGEIADCAFQNTLIRVRPNGPDPEYLLHYFRHQAVSGHFAAAARGVGIHHLGSDALAKWMLPLPPLAEQRRIAAVLNRADALCAKRRRSSALLEQLFQSVFQDMFGDLLINERTWPVVSIGAFVRKFESGKNIVSDDASDQSSLFRVLKTSAITSLRFRAEETKPVPGNYDPPVRHIVREGDLLFGRANTGDLIGATALVRGVRPNVLLPDKIWRFVWPTELTADPHWVLHLFRTKGMRMEMTRRASGTSESMKNISQEKVLSIQIGLPDLELQAAYVQRASAIERSYAMRERATENLNGLFASLQQRAFAGEL